MEDCVIACGTLMEKSHDQRIARGLTFPKHGRQVVFMAKNKRAGITSGSFAHRERVFKIAVQIGGARQADQAQPGKTKQSKARARQY